MQPLSLSAATLVTAASPSNARPAVSGSSSAGFSNVLATATKELEGLRNDADQNVRGLMMGDGTDIHTAMIATQKADLAFELALAARNKAVGAYQQLMNMQF